MSAFIKGPECQQQFIVNRGSRQNLVIFCFASINLNTAVLRLISRFWTTNSFCAWNLRVAKHCLILESLLSAASQETATEAAVCLKMRPKPFGKINNLVEVTTGKHTNIVHVITHSAGRERHTEHLLLLLLLSF